MACFAFIERSDGGRTGLQVDRGIDKSGAAPVAPVRKCPKNDDVFLAGTRRIWRTNDFFSSAMPSWIANNQVTEASGILSVGFAAAETGCDTYAYGTARGLLRLTRDGGTTWTDLDPSTTLEGRPINSVAFDPTNTNRVFVARSGYDDVAPNKPGHIFRTENALASSPTWTRIGFAQCAVCRHAVQRDRDRSTRHASRVRGQRQRLVAQL